MTGLSERSKTIVPKIVAFGAACGEGPAMPDERSYYRYGIRRRRAREKRRRGRPTRTRPEGG